MSRTLLLGCIADDFTGATDLANNLVRGGMRTVQTIGVPAGELVVAADAVVVALKSRTIAPDDAVSQSLAALRWLRAQGAAQIYFKYCSTFDSRYTGELRGNIGPVTEALMAALGTDFTIATPAFPDNGRTVFKGHLFVGDQLLQDSSMKAHPLTPMTDSNLVRVLQAQCTRRVGLIDHRVVAAGAPAIRRRIAELRAEGVGIAIVDAIGNDDLMRLGAALADWPLVTAGSGVAIGLPANHGLAPSPRSASLPVVSGPAAVVAGSCSEATQRQVQAFAAAGLAVHRLDVLRLVGAGGARAEGVAGVACGADDGRGASGKNGASGVSEAGELSAAVDSSLADEALAWARPRLEQGPVLIASTADAATVREAQQALGGDAIGRRVEQVLAAIARRLVHEAGVRRLVVAGGETSGACVQALEIHQLQIGEQIDPGVPWCHAFSSLAPPAGLHIALKSGNFGSDDFFVKTTRASA